MADRAVLEGELISVPERLILAPAPGRFRPLRNDPGPEGDRLTSEEIIGFVDGPGMSTPVQSLFCGGLMGLLVSPGERVREGQPVAWLRVAPEQE